MSSLYVDIDAITEKFDRKINKVVGDLDKFSERAGNMGNKLSLIVTTPLLAAAGLMSRAASDMEESLGKVNVSFQESSKQVVEFSKTTLKSFGIAESSALDMASTFGDMATSMGLNNQAAAEMSTSLVGLAGDLSSFKNIRLEVANNALKSIFTGETESLKSLGVVMTQANLSAFALSKGIRTNIQNMSESEKVALRYAFVMEKTSKAQGDFERTGGNFAGQMRVMQESIKQLSTNFGKLLLPAFTKAVKFANRVIESIDNLDDSVKRNILFGAGLVALAGPALVVFAKFVSLAKGIGVAFGAAAGPIGAVVALLVAGATVVYSNWKSIIELLTKMQAKFVQLSIGFGKVLNKFGLITDEEFLNASKESAKTIGMWAKMLGKKPGTEFQDSIKQTTDLINDMLAGIKGVNSETEGGFITKAFAGIDTSAISSKGFQNEGDGERARIWELSEMLGIDIDKSIDDVLPSKLAEAGEKIKSHYVEFTDFIRSETIGNIADVSQAVSLGIGLLGDSLTQAFASVFSGGRINFKQGMKQLLGGFLSALGDMVMAMAVQLKVVSAAKAKIEAALAGIGTGGIALAGAIGLFALGAAMKGGGMALSSSVGQTQQIQPSGTFQGGGSTFQGMQPITVNLTGELRGQGTDLVAVINQTQTSWNG